MKKVKSSTCASALKINILILLVLVSMIFFVSGFEGGQPQVEKLVQSTANPTKLTLTRQLSLSERVAYQYAIEEFYWRHRIWPKENSKPKPRLDEVISAIPIQKKVEDYVRNSQFLAEQWQQPITPQQLQAE